MEVSVGSGENRFTMSRGSFKYRQKFFEKRQLVLKNEEKTEQGYILTYLDPKEKGTAKTSHRFLVSVEGTQIRIAALEEANKRINRYWITFDTNPGEHIYGCGETYSKFDVKGEKVRIWVAEHQNTGRISTKIIKEKIFGKHPQKALAFDKYESYYAQPTFVSSDKYFVHCNVNAYSEFDFRKSDKITLYFQERPEIIIDSGKDFAEVSKKLSTLLGRQRELPQGLYDGVILGIRNAGMCGARHVK